MSSLVGHRFLRGMLKAANVVSIRATLSIAAAAGHAVLLWLDKSKVLRCVTRWDLMASL